MPEKKEMITVYVENMGRGKASIADSLITIRDFPNRKEGKQAVGVLATKTEMPESHLKAFKDVLEVYYPHQTNVLSTEEYEEKKKEALRATKPETSPPEPPPNGPTEKDIYEAAMNGGETEILAYMEDYPNGEYTSQIEERTVYLSIKAKPTKKAAKEYNAKYPSGIYIDEINQFLGTN